MAYILRVEHDVQPPSAQLRESVGRILDDARLLVLATAGPEGGPHATTAYFAYDNDLWVYFVSDRSTRHSANVRDDPRAMAAVFVEPPGYGDQLRGLQLAGSVTEAGRNDTAHALAVFQRRFPSFADDPAVRDRFHRADGPAVLYRFRVDTVTVIDEPRFGADRYIKATVTR